MKSLLYFWIFACLTLLSVACYDDKGNYDYTEINEVTITGMQEKYSKTSYTDTLYIAPVLETTKSGDTFEYLWTVNKAYTILPSMGGKIDIDTIGTEETLNYPLELRMGQYDLVLKVTNQHTGHAIFYKSNLEVTTPFSLGFYVLKGENGQTDIDLHLPNGNKMEDVLHLKYGNAMTGDPTSMGLIFSYCYINPETNEYTFTPALTICAGKDAKILNLQDMSTIFSHDNMFWGDAPMNETPLYICPNYFGISYLSDQGAYFSYQYLTIPGSGKFGYTLDVEKNYIPNIHCIAYSSLYFFDDLNHRLLVCDFNGGMHTYDAMPEIPYELKFFGRNTSGGDTHGYALFQDESSHTMYLYALILDMKFDKNPIRKTVEIPASSKLYQANLYGINEENARVMYFVSGNKIYAFDPEDYSEQALNFEGLPADEEITYISNRFWTFEDDKENNFNYLAVGTYKNGTYHVYLYNTLGGRPTGAPDKILSGKGRMTGMQFISNIMNDNANHSSYYPATF